MTLSSNLRVLAAPVLMGAARIALGILWLNEGILKYRAHFGSADIQLVVDGAMSNSRVPGYFTEFATLVMDPLTELFGVAIPAMETGLGIVLVIGVLVRPAAALSAVMLMTYWMADQLIGQYPIMVLLSVAVVAFPHAASGWSLPTLLVSRRTSRAAIPDVHR
ncbi:DoxX family membrane protein [Gordonia insulae]|uniref:DoxX family protein n=1 Tax=Gordonia insulae TaxID=2420509 RepID=A0A3G8JSS4_9ACTN|nr:DoxX family membrane protein [Gordonia insulae]AZG47552.1 hypothetical protein D7316_04163 [Gordonia insulae]